MNKNLWMKWRRRISSACKKLSIARMARFWMVLGLGTQAIIVLNNKETGRIRKLSLEEPISMDTLVEFSGGTDTLMNELDLSESLLSDIKYLPVELFALIDNDHLVQMANSVQAINLLNCLGDDREKMEAISDRLPVHELINDIDMLPYIKPTAFYMLDPWEIINLGSLNQEQFLELIHFNPDIPTMTDEWYMLCMEEFRPYLQLLPRADLDADYLAHSIALNFNMVNCGLKGHSVLPESTVARLAYIYQKDMEKEKMKISEAAAIVQQQHHHHQQQQQHQQRQHPQQGRAQEKDSIRNAKSSHSSSGGSFGA